MSPLNVLEEKRRKRLREYHRNWRNRRTPEQKRRARERVNKRRRDRYNSNPRKYKEQLERTKARRKKRIEFDPNYRSFRREQSVAYRYKVRLKILELLGSKCRHCGFSDWRALQIDHVNGGGRKERREGGYSSLNPSAYLKKILKTPRKYQLLCANCNSIKRHENREWNQVNKKEGRALRCH